MNLLEVADKPDAKLLDFYGNWNLLTRSKDRSRKNLALMWRAVCYLAAGEKTRRVRWLQRSVGIITVAILQSAGREYYALLWQHLAKHAIKDAQAAAKADARYAGVAHAVVGRARRVQGISLEVAKQHETFKELQEPDTETNACVPVQIYGVAASELDARAAVACAKSLAGSDVLFENIPTEEDVQKAKSHCFVATACCGTPDHWAVVALRRYRDERLLRSYLGARLVAAYYRLSPPLARWLAARPRLRRLVRRYVVEPLARLARSTLHE